MPIKTSLKMPEIRGDEYEFGHWTLIYLIISIAKK